MVHEIGEWIMMAFALFCVVVLASFVACIVEQDRQAEQDRR
jgi:hypothetical protein